MYIMCQAFSETEVKALRFNYGTREHVVRAEAAEMMLWNPLISAIFQQLPLDMFSILQSNPEYRLRVNQKVNLHFFTLFFFIPGGPQKAARFYRMEY